MVYADEPHTPVELGRSANVAAFACAVAGIFAVGAGFQVAAFVVFRSAWAGWFPWVELGTGLGCVWLAVQLAHPRVWALGAAFAALGALALSGFVWAG